MAWANLTKLFKHKVQLPSSQQILNFAVLLDNKTTEVQMADPTHFMKIHLFSLSSFPHKRNEITIYLHSAWVYQLRTFN